MCEVNFRNLAAAAGPVSN